ncbi:MAG: Gfo/Idh/MocA family oxidoreductase [Solirubrobacteraceae bacterium]
MAQLRAAIIGYGLAGRCFHAPLIAASEGLAVAAIVTANAERREQAGREHPEAHVFECAAQLWRRASEWDFVVIAAANDAHAPLAARAIEHGLAVVVDKPLAPTSELARDLVARAARAGVPLTVFQNRRWDSDQLTLGRLIREGRLGTVRRYESRFERWRPSPVPGSWRGSTAPAQGGGQLLDLGSHLIDQALVLFGAVTHVYGEVDARRGELADDDAFVALRHAGGVISHLHASAFTAAPGPRLRVLGTQAAFVVDGLDGQEGMLRSGRRPDAADRWGAEPEAAWGRLVSGESAAPVRSEPGDWPCFYRLLAEALRDGAPAPVDARDAVAALEVLEAARASSASRSVIALA